MRAFAGQAPRRGLLHHPPSAHAFPPGLPLAMPSFSTAYVRDGISFPLTVIGLDPARGLTTTIPTVIFAYRLRLADGTVFDASSDVIDGVTPVQGVLASPIFKPAHWTAGGVSHGTTQWSDVVMRANFAGRMAVGYHVLLGTPTVIPITVDVPAAFGTSVVDPQPGVREAFIDAEWLSNLIIQVTQSQVLRQRPCPSTCSRRSQQRLQMNSPLDFTMPTHSRPRPARRLLHHSSRRVTSQRQWWIQSAALKLQTPGSLHTSSPSG
jgi:hypothetical protein